MPRKKPFSVKQKKKQLQDKRERKRGQGGGGAAAQLGRRGVPPLPHRGREGWGGSGLSRSRVGCHGGGFPQRRGCVRGLVRGSPAAAAGRGDDLQAHPGGNWGARSGGWRSLWRSWGG